MENLSGFFNPKPVKSEKYVASDRYTDEKGNPLEWEIRSITTEENEVLMKECTRAVPARRGRGGAGANIDFTAYNAKLAVACTASPNLHDVKLQDAYKVKDAETLLKAMLRLPGEYAAYTSKVIEVCGFDKDFGELVDEVKNS